MRVPGENFRSVGVTPISITYRGAQNPYLPDPGSDKKVGEKECREFHPARLLEPASERDRNTI